MDRIDEIAKIRQLKVLATNVIIDWLCGVNIASVAVCWSCFTLHADKSCHQNHSLIHSLSIPYILLISELYRE